MTNRRQRSFRLLRSSEKTDKKVLRLFYQGIIIEQMAKYRKILHLDLDAFFCAVEELLNPSLKGKKFAVGGSPDRRGVVSTCSYAARKYGIHSAMPMSQAIRRCPDLIIVHSGFEYYREKSHEVMEILHHFTPLVEQISIDEAFLDVTDLPQPIEEIARSVQKEINQKPHLPCSLGAASNKLVAKIADNIGKKKVKTDTYPNAINWIPNGREAEFLSPLNVDELWGVGKKTAQTFENLGISTIGQLAAYPVSLLVSYLGKSAAEYHDRALGIDDSPVEPGPAAAKSISQETTFERDVSDETILRETIRRQSDQVGFRLRSQKLSGNTVKIKLRWSDFTTITRQTKSEIALSQNSLINKAAQELFDSVWLVNPRPVRLIGVGVSGIEKDVRQLSLFSAETEKEDHFLQAVDQIRNKYGDQALTRAAEISQKPRNLKNK